MRGGRVLGLMLLVTTACAVRSRPSPGQPTPRVRSQEPGWLAKWLSRGRRAPDPPVFAQILPPLTASDAVTVSPPRSPGLQASSRPPGPAPRPMLIESGGPPAAASPDAALADVLTSLVAAVEGHNGRLRKIDLEIEQIDREMVDLYHSEGWALEVESRQLELDDTTRLDARRGWTRRTDGTFRRAYDLFGDLDENSSEFTLRLTRSWGHADHEKYVDIALKRLQLMDAVIRKQEVRRDLHLGVLDTVFDVLYRQRVLPLADQLAQATGAKLERLRKYYESDQREALLKDVLEAEHELDEAHLQRSLDQRNLQLGLSELRRAANDEHLTLPTTVPLAAAQLRPPDELNEQEATSYALAGRLDYVIGQMRLELGRVMARYMAWYWPKLNFEIWLTRFHGHRKWLDEYRRDKGKERGLELNFELPLNLPARGRARQQAFQAAHDRYAVELEQMRSDIESETIEAYLLWRQAYLDYVKARNALERRVEEARHTRNLARTLPELIQGIPEIKVAEAEIDVVAARIDLVKAEKALVQAKARWDYLVGNSPVDTAVAPSLARERRAVERKGWLQWWTSLIR